MVTLNGGRPINIHEVPSAARVPRRTFDILVLKLERNQSKKSHHRQIKKDKIWSNISKISTTEIRYWGVPLIGFIVSSFFFLSNHSLEHFATWVIVLRISNQREKEKKKFKREKDSRVYENFKKTGINILNRINYDPYLFTVVWKNYNI